MQDVKAGTSTGVSAKDRCLTVKALASSDSKPNYFRRPGHVFPLRYREGMKVLEHGIRMQFHHLVRPFFLLGIVYNTTIERLGSLSPVYLYWSVAFCTVS
jgi:hypothetical protein